ncbi:MAG: hypothetical protein Q9159_004848 [Coniocarpon cinnabarinum]
MATSKGPDWGRLPLPLSTAPDTNSPVFPERPIRPLPKRRLRSRLSEGEASSIDRPLDLSSSPSVFGSPAISREGTVQSRRQGNTYTTLRNPDFGRLTTPGAYESDEDREDDNYPGQRSSWSDNMLRYPRGSATSSVDGESFENTNNKKKRKIPLHHNSNFPVDANDSDPGYGPNWQTDGAGPAYNTGKNVSAGSSSKARNVRNGPKTGKQPLATSVNGLNHGDGIEPGAGRKSSGMRYPHGQENRRVSSNHQTNNGQNNDFTFTAPSESAKHLNQASRAGVFQHPPLTQQTRSTTQGTQTTPTNSGAHSATSPDPNSTAHNANAANASAQQADPNNADNRRQLTTGELIRNQATDRKREQRLLNRRKTMTRGDVTLCDYCLYEAIFLERPRALLRSYELKELKKRQEQENRRRLLEKAKAKSRKTRKQGGGSNNGANNRQQQGQQNVAGANQPKTGAGGAAAGSAGAENGQFDRSLYEEGDAEGEYYDDEGDFAEAEGEGYYEDEGYVPPLESAGGVGDRILKAAGRMVSPTGGYEGVAGKH